MTIAALFELKGEWAFRDHEAKMVETVVEEKDAVVALGGGALMNPASAEKVLDSGHLVYLRTGVETIVERMRTEHRPLVAKYAGPALARRVKELLVEREPIYQLAHIQIDTDGKTAEEVAELVVRKVKECDESR